MLGKRFYSPYFVYLDKFYTCDFVDNKTCKQNANI